MTEQPSLYERLGGLEVLEKFAQVVVKRCMLDETIGHIWNHMTEDQVQKEINGFIDWMCEHWGGPRKYHGPDMATIHRGMGITEEYWDALFALDVLSDPQFGLTPELVEEVEVFLRSFKRSVVGSPSFKDVVKAHPDMDVMQGMKGVGIKWPTAPGPVPS